MESVLGQFKFIRLLTEVNIFVHQTIPSSIFLLLVEWPTSTLYPELSVCLIVTSSPPHLAISENFLTSPPWLLLSLVSLTLNLLDCSPPIALDQLLSSIFLDFDFGLWNASHYSRASLGVHTFSNLSSLRLPEKFSLVFLKCWSDHKMCLLKFLSCLQASQTHFL